jgi:hypothetical protein
VLNRIELKDRRTFGAKDHSWGESLSENGSYNVKLVAVGGGY